MSSWIRFAFCVLAVWLGVGLNGCEPSGQSQLDEEKEPHFVLGQSRVNAMDYQGAVEAFEESLEANPHSAAAHYQLACLFDTKESDPAAAIYHYQEYLKLNSNADNADVIRQRIYACKQQLATDVLPLPDSPAAQQQLEKLIEQNRQLQDEVDKWHAYYASQLAAAKTNSPPQNNSVVEQTANPTPILPTQNVPPQTGGANAGSSANPTSTPPRAHTVVAGETATGIARKSGVKLTALQSANLGVNLSHIRVGQVLNIPPP